jgi:predicted nucleic acid-binding protein
MTRYLVDTNVISELSRPRPNAAALRWLEERETVVLSAITIEELTFGIERMKGSQREHLLTWLAGLLQSGARIVEVTSDVASTAGRLRALRESKGRPVAQADMLVAACALGEGLVLATRNVRDFEGCGLTLENPFDR